MPEPHLRASDSDRAAVATALGEHMAAGRLTLAEYEERLTRVYETKTLGGLAALTADLPPTTRPQAPASSPARPPVPMWGPACGPNPWGAAGHSSWRSWLSTALIVLAVWAVTSIASNEPLYFWPMWVIGPWGAVLLVQTLAGSRAGGTEPDRGRDTGELPRLRA